MVGNKSERMFTLIYPMSVLDDRVVRGLWARLRRESRERTPYQTTRKAS